VNGLVCDHSLDGGASCIFGCHATNGVGDTCPTGAHCSDVGSGVGVCLENGRDGGASSGGGGNDGGQGNGTDGGGTSSGGGGNDGGSSSGSSDSGSGGGRDGSEGDSGAFNELDSSSSDATVSGDGGESADASGAGDATSEEGGSGADGSSNPGTVEGAGCSCSTARGAASTPDLVFGGLALVTLGLVARYRSGQRRPHGKKNRAGRAR
jgi:MYXO-CTERM domain-containing protein